MLEQIITSIAFVLLNLSIYNLTERKGERKKRITIFLTAQTLVFISFAIPFSTEYFYYQHNLILLFYSWGLGIFYLMLIAMGSYILPVVLYIFLQTASKEECRKYSSFFVKAIRWIYLFLIMIADLTFIWDTETFSKMVTELFN